MEKKTAKKQRDTRKKTRGKSNSSVDVENAVEFRSNAPDGKETARKKKAARTKETGKSGKKRTEPAAETAEITAEIREEQPKRKSRKDIRRQKNRYRILTGILLVILVGIIGFISLKVLFVVHRFEVRGTERYTDEEILAFCSIPLDMNIFDVDVDSYSRALPENFTYIDSAKVKRKLPDKIQINIVDCVPTYYNVNEAENEGDEETYNIFSQNFKHLTIRSSQPETLMRIDTDLGDEQAFRTTKQLIEILEDKGYEGVTAIRVTDEAVSMVYENRVRVELGSMFDIEYKLKMAFHCLEKELSPNERGVIDATKPGKAVYNMEI